VKVWGKHLKWRDVTGCDGKGRAGKGREGKGREGKGREVNCGVDVKGVKCSVVEWREGHGEMWVHQFMTIHILLLLVFSV
jgi:hypothetical protein